MAVTTTKTNKPINPRGNDQSPKGYNRAALYSGKALDFDGVNDSISEQTISIDSTNFSVSFYTEYENHNLSSVVGLNFGPGSTQAYNLVIYPFDGVNDSFRIYSLADGANIVNDSSIPILDTWTHYLITSDGSNLKIYQNGQLVKSVAYTESRTFTRFQIGKLIGGTQYYKGGLSNIKLFSTALTAAQVSDLYNNPEKIVPTGVEDTALKLWLPMMEGAGTTAYDGSGNGNHGTISGATYVNGVGSPVAQTAVIDWNKGTNLLKYSEELDRGSYWATTATIVTANDTTAPDGQETADLLKETTTSAPHYINIGVTTAASTTYVQSAWVKKKDDGIYAGVRTNGVGGNSYIIFDFDTATIVATGSDIISSGVEAYSNGWYRIYMTYTLAPTGAIYSVTNSSSSVIPSYTGTGKGYYIWGAQLEAADALTAYIPNHTDSAITSPVLLPQGLTSGRDITGVNLFENVRKQGALNLDGNSWAEVHDNASVDVSEFTLEGWIYTNSITSDNRILSKWFSGYPNRTFQFSATNDDLYLYISDGSSSNNTFVLNVLSLNNWYHCVATYDGANLKIYLDGVLQSTTASTMTLKDSNEPVYIGAYVGSLDPSDNTTAQPRIYNRALTAEEVQRNYDAGKNIYS